MAYALNALIAELALLRGALELPVIALPHGWGLVPLPQGSWRAEGHHARPLIHASECRLAPDDDFDDDPLDDDSDDDYTCSDCGQDWDDCNCPRNDDDD